MDFYSPKYPEERVGQWGSVCVTEVCQSTHALQLVVQQKGLEGRVLLLWHDEVVEVTDPEPQGPPLAHWGQAGQLVPVFSLRAAGQLVDVHRHLGNLRVFGSLSPVHHRHSQRQNIRRNVAAMRVIGLRKRETGQKGLHKQLRSDINIARNARARSVYRVLRCFCLALHWLTRPEAKSKVVVMISGSERV